jgi:carbamoylphosphate synthase small subunit
MKSGKINGKKNLNAADCGKKKNLMYTFTRKSTEIILTQASLERQKITAIMMATDKVTFLK